MDLLYSDEDLAFREEVRNFIAEKLPQEIRDANARGAHISKPLAVKWQKILHERGWVAPNWPAEYGGPGWTSIQKHIFAEEYQAADCPAVSGFGVTMVGPVIYTYGTDEQKKQHLPKILSGDVYWCQGYSEPGSGSDLASLQTRAIQDGDEYVVNGQKIWTSLAHLADWIFCLVRTDAEVKQQEGITFLLFDIKSKGVTIKPIISMDGRHHLNEVFFDDVRVPVSNRIAEENMGWTYAKYLLGHERAGIAQIATHKRTINKVKSIASQELAYGGALIDDPAFKARLAEVSVSLEALALTDLRMQANISAGRSPGDQSSTLKVSGTQIGQELNEILIQALAYYGLPYSTNQFQPDWNEPPVGPEYTAGIMADRLLRRASSIYGGSNEIQKNIIAKRVLGL
ncbi:acyl-CoA dehydrogenase family protein [Alphaproteobacteria bacterium]|jgi:alkylation response protein AidB-like acyl-CoA dehydrogenase|nr:acyl-CoA dehydrogenase family protein [Alphaproteobacteria bacterium]